MDKGSKLRDGFHSMLNDRYALDGRDPNSVPGLCGAMGSLTGHSILRPIHGKGQAT